MEELAKEHPEWRSGGGKQNFLKHISSIGLSLEVVSSFCRSNNRPIPSRMPPQQRTKLVNYLLNNKDLLENLKKGVGSSDKGEDKRENQKKQDNKTRDNSSNLQDSSKEFKSQNECNNQNKNGQEIKTAS